MGHVSAVLSALKSADFDEVWILPSGKRVDREIPTSVDYRKNLSTLFVEYLQIQTSVPIKLVTDALEEVSGKFTHEVIVDLKSNPENEVYQLCGIDGFTSIKERVIGPNEKFIIVKRSGYEIPEELNSKPNLFLIDEEVGGISSTIIREMIKSGYVEYKKLVPDKVANYIEGNNLYL